MPRRGRPSWWCTLIRSGSRSGTEKLGEVQNFDADGGTAGEMTDEGAHGSRSSKSSRREKRERSHRKSSKDESRGEHKITKDSLAGMGEHSGSRLALVLINFLIFAGTVALNQLTAFPQYTGDLFAKVRDFTTRYGLGVPPLGVFNTSVGNLSAIKEIDVTPAGFTFVIWCVIYAWLLFAHLYALILLCRRNAVGPVYTSPSVLTQTFLITYTLNLLANIAWIFVWDRQLYIYSSAVLWFICLTNWIALGILHGSVYRHGPWMSRHAKVDLWMFRILWHNGMALYTTWTTIAALLNLGIALRYEANLEMQIVVYVVLGSLSGIMVLWFILENTVLDRFVRYTVTPYAVIVLAMVGIYIKQYADATLESGYFIVVLLGVAVFCLVARLGLVIVRSCKNPLYTSNKIGDDPVLSFAA